MNKIQHVYKDVNGNPVYKAERTIYDKKKKKFFRGCLTGKILEPDQAVCQGWKEFPTAFPI